MDNNKNIAMNGIKIREAGTDDAKKILEIYSYYVLNTAISFEYEVPTLKEFQNRMKNIMVKYPYIVLEHDDEILGYAYAGMLKDRAAYDWSCETTVYIDKNARNRGYGRLLYESLEERLKNIGITNMYAAVAYPETEDEYLDNNSLEFHKHMGFAEAGNFHKCGYKYNRWYNLAWMEKIIGAHL